MSGAINAAPRGEFAGALRHRLLVERRQDGIDALAGPLEAGPSGAWLQDGALWAAIVPDGSAAAVAGNMRSARPRYRVTIRTRAIGLGHCLRWGERVLAILAIEEDPRNPDRLLLMVEERP